VRSWLDASAAVAFVLDEPGAEVVENALRGGATLMAAVNYGEALDVLIRREGLDGRRVARAFGLLVESGMRVADVTAPLAERAAELRRRRYHRARNPLSLADCILLASARPDDRVVSGDAGVIATARNEGIATVALASPAA
jgi:uncharacterized protein with PIN domain